MPATAPKTIARTKRRVSPARWSRPSTRVGAVDAMGLTITRPDPEHDYRWCAPAAVVERGVRARALTHSLRRARAPDGTDSRAGGATLTDGGAAGAASGRGARS